METDGEEEKGRFLMAAPPMMPSGAPPGDPQDLLMQALQGLDPVQQQLVQAALADPMVLETIVTLAHAGADQLSGGPSPEAMMFGGGGMPPGGGPGPVRP